MTCSPCAPAWSSNWTASPEARRICWSTAASSPAARSSWSTRTTASGSPRSSPTRRRADGDSRPRRPDAHRPGRRPRLHVGDRPPLEEAGTRGEHHPGRCPRPSSALAQRLRGGRPGPRPGADRRHHGRPHLTDRRDGTRSRRARHREARPPAEPAPGASAARPRHRPGRPDRRGPAPHAHEAAHPRAGRLSVVPRHLAPDHPVAARPHRPALITEADTMRTPTQRTTQIQLPTRTPPPTHSQPAPRTHGAIARRRLGIVGALLGLLVVLVTALGLGAQRASAETPTAARAHVAAVAPAAAGVHLAAAAGPTAPKPPTAPAAPAKPGTVTVNLGGQKPSQSLTLLLTITVLTVAPSLLLLVTSFTKIFVVLSLTRNALGLNSVPPNQVLAGLSLFLSLFVMGPVLSAVNKLGIQPYLHGTKSRSLAWHDGIEPLRTFMLHHTRPQEIALMLRAGGHPNPANKADLDLTALIPAFVLSELRAAMIIGFVIFIPFVIIDLVVSSTLMSLGMMMLPPVSVSMPFKLLLFVLVDGWGLIITSLIRSYRGG